MSKEELDRGDKLLLLNPRQYKGYACHPTEDKTIRRVLNATITRYTYRSSWYNIEIVFEEGHVFSSSSSSIKGCKQIFAFQCSAGSKWEKERSYNN